MPDDNTKITLVSICNNFTKNRFD